jgi:hypothetical protein
MSIKCLRTRTRAVSGFLALFRSLALGILVWPAIAFAEPAADAIDVNVD